MENGFVDRERQHRFNMRQRAQRNANDILQNGVPPFGAMAYGGQQQPQRKLVLHFDLRNTILVADSVTNIKVEQALNSYLTGVTWGQETKKGGWEWFSETPSLTSHQPDAITYYKHLEQRMVRIPSDRAHLRNATGSFTKDAIGCTFRPFFERHLELLQWNHDNVADPKLTMTGEDGKLYHYILPSFFKLIHHLYSMGRDFSIIIRTYGMDASNVLACTEYCLQGKRHPTFQESLPLKTDTIPGRITRDCNGIQAHKLTANPQGRKSPFRNNCYCTDRDIYNMLGSQTGVSGFVDDFRYWQNNDYHYTAGKPIWVDPFDPTVQHIIFDDNARVTDYDSIVDIRVFEADSDQAHSISTQESCRFSDVCVVQADLLESTSNEDYFIHKVNLCEENYSTLLATYASIESAQNDANY